MKVLRFGALVGVILLVTAGCATSPPSSFYTLTPLREPIDGANLRGEGLGVGLGPLTFPRFLDRPQIVRRDAANRLAINEFHRWGGSIQDDFLRVWIENLSALLGSSRIFAYPAEVRYPLDFRVTADVLAFEGGEDGDAVLRIRWIVLDPATERVLQVQDGRYRRPLAEPGDEAALVAALSEALGAFSRDVAATLERLPRPLPARSDRTGSEMIPSTP